MTMSLEIFLGALCTFAVFTYLYRENPVYRLFENIFIGIAIGHITVLTINTIVSSGVAPILRQGDMTYAIPLILGVSMYFYFSKKYFYLYRIPMAILIGTGLGLGVNGLIQGVIIQQLKANIVVPAAQGPVSLLNGLIVVVGSLLVLYYFVFTFFIKPTRMTAIPSRAARYILMLTFGAFFAANMLTVSTYLGGRMIFLLQTDAIYLIPVAAVLFAAGVLYDKYSHKSSTF